MKILVTLTILMLTLSACAAETAPVAESPEATTTMPMSETSDSSDMSDMDDMDEGEEHEHEEGEVREWDTETVPVIDLSVTEIDGAWFVTTQVSGFTLTGVDDTEAVPGEGHLHLFVDGQLETMVYEDEYELSNLSPGDHQIMVSLSTNDHLEYVLDGEAIMAMTTVSVAGEAQAADVNLAVVIVGGEIQAPIDPEIPLGSTVEIRIQSDQSDHVHVHGYDIELVVDPGVETVISFVADIPGIFEVELEDSQKFVMSLRIQ